MIYLPLLIDKKSNNYNVILVIVNYHYLTKLVHYKPIKTIINMTRKLEIIIDVVVKHHSLL